MPSWLPDAIGIPSAHAERAVASACLLVTLSHGCIHEQGLKRAAPGSGHGHALQGGQSKRPRLQNTLLHDIPAWTEKALNQMNNLCKRKHAVWFRYPVLTENLPDYLSIVTRPMDLKTVTQHLRAGAYHSPAAFAAVRPLPRPSVHAHGSCTHLNATALGPACGLCTAS